MAFTLQPAIKDDFVNREDILTEMLSSLQDQGVRMGFALVGPGEGIRNEEHWNAIIDFSVSRMQGEFEDSCPEIQTWHEGS